MKFRTSQAGQITAVRYFRPSSEIGTHIGRLWSQSGTVLGSVAFANETSSGWQIAFFATPVSLNAATTNLVTVNCNTYYAATNGGLGSVVPYPPLSTIADDANSLYGSINQFPTNSYQNTNYFRDVLFEPTATTPFQQWQRTNFTSTQRANPAISGNLADPDGDGLVNLLEYALGGDPLVNGTAILPVVSVSGGALTLTYQRARSDVTYVVETSTDLLHWTTTGITQGSGGIGSQITASLPISSISKDFLRLRVDQ